MKKYNLYLIIEEDHSDENEELVDEARLVMECDTLMEAVVLRGRLLDQVTKDGEVVWVPPVKASATFKPRTTDETTAEYYVRLSQHRSLKKALGTWNPHVVDICPECQSPLMPGPNGSTICSKDGCNYWRE